ncbi:hypothetical protein K438DRAFT_1751580 [Mycena galopus ATCC 62051]|nr:hypothetical protein K438DRAFT_1751580 [Mycena galopus ATCC 62051]
MSLLLPPTIWCSPFFSSPSLLFLRPPSTSNSARKASRPNAACQYYFSPASHRSRRLLRCRFRRTNLQQGDRFRPQDLGSRTLKLKTSSPQDLFKTSRGPRSGSSPLRGAQRVPCRAEGWLRAGSSPLRGAQGVPCRGGGRDVNGGGALATVIDQPPKPGSDAVRGTAQIFLALRRFAKISSFFAVGFPASSPLSPAACSSVVPTHKHCSNHAIIIFWRASNLTNNPARRGGGISRSQLFPAWSSLSVATYMLLGRANLKQITNNTITDVGSTRHRIAISKRRRRLNMKPRRGRGSGGGNKHEHNPPTTSKAYIPPAREVFGCHKQNCWLLTVWPTSTELRSSLNVSPLFRTLCVPIICLHFIHTDTSIPAQATKSFFCHERNLLSTVPPTLHPRPSTAIESSH